jgi:hypothetical protein
VIYNAGELSVLNSTFYSNTATYSDTTLYSSGGEGEGTPLAVYLYNTLIGGATNGVPHCESALLSANVNNLIEDGSCSPMLSGDPSVGALTLPLDVLPALSDKACRWDATLTKWDCGPDADNSGSGAGPVAMPDIVVRYPVTQLSDWTVGNNVGPNAVALCSLFAARDAIGLLALGLFAVALTYYGWRREHTYLKLPG